MAEKKICPLFSPQITIEMSLLGKRQFADYVDSQGLFLTQDDIMPFSQRSYVSRSPMSMRSGRRMVVSSYRRGRYAKRKIPRAIQTRGTPNGYYELPIRVFFKLYVNSSTGAWNTDPQSGVTSGATGYQGIGVSYDYSNVYVDLGNGSVSSTITIPISGAAELQNVFDVCKMYEMKWESYWTNGSGGVTSNVNLIGAPELFLTYDPDDALPPANQGVVLQYTNFMRIPGNSNRTYKRTYYPKIRTDLGTSADPTGTTTTLAGSQSATYFDLDKPAVRHMGLRGFFNIPQQQGAPVTVSYLNVMLTLKRRFKTVK